MITVRHRTQFVNSCAPVFAQLAAKARAARWKNGGSAQASLAKLQRLLDKCRASQDVNLGHDSGYNNSAVRRWGSGQPGSADDGKQLHSQTRKQLPLT